MVYGLLHHDRHLTLLGSGPSLRHAPLADERTNYWGLTQLWGKVPRLDCVVEIHLEVDIRGDGMWDQLHAITAPVFTVREFQNLRTRRRFPLDEAIAQFCVPGQVKVPLGSTFDYLMALALLHDPPPVSIAVYGFDMHQDAEYVYQRHTAGFWLGVAWGRGIAVTLPPTSELLKVRFLYGIEAAEHWVAGLDARERAAYFAVKHDQALYQVSEALAQVPLLPARQQVEAIKLARQALNQAMFARGVATEAAFQAHRLKH